MTDNDVLLPLVNKFFENNLENAVHILESLSEEEASVVLKTLPTALTARVLKILQVSYAAILLKDADNAFLGAIAPHLDSQFIALMLMQLPKDARERMSAHITEKLKKEVRELLDYPEDSVGRIMTMDFIVLKKDDKAEEAIEKTVRWPRGVFRHPMFTW